MVSSQLYHSKNFFCPTRQVHRTVVAEMNNISLSMPILTLIMAIQLVKLILVPQEMPWKPATYLNDSNHLFDALNVIATPHMSFNRLGINR